MSPKTPLVKIMPLTDSKFKRSDFFKPRQSNNSPSNPFQNTKRTPNQDEASRPSVDVYPNSVKRKLRQPETVSPSPSRTYEGRQIEEVVISDSERESTGGRDERRSAAKLQCRSRSPLSPHRPSSSTYSSRPLTSRPLILPQNRPSSYKPKDSSIQDAFDFANDPKVLSLQKTLVSIIDPEGRRNQEELHSYMAATSARCVADAKIPSNKKLQTWKPGNSKKGLASFDDFRCANGAPVRKEMQKVVGNDESEFSSGSRQGTKYLGNKPIRATFKPPSRSNSLQSSSSSHPAVATFDAAFEKATSMCRDPQGLAAEPSLKHFDNNIISLIESEIMSLDGSTTWADVAGLEGPKKVLKEIVVWPFLRPDIFKGIRAPPKGVLLFGPPGTGKTMIGRCVASQCKATFFNISASSLTSKWVGEGEKLVRALFAVARLKLPSVIFIDEIDSLLSSRSESEHESSRRIKTEFLVQLDGVATSRDERLLVLGATNRPYELDEAARRRFAKRLYIGLPEKDARTAIVTRSLEEVEHSLTAADYSEVSDVTEGYSGADMHQLCAEAAMGPIRDAMTTDIESVNADSIRSVGLDDLKNAAKVVRATVVEKDLKAYAEWDKTFGCLL